MPLKLNIGAGKTAIEGFTPIDRHLGSEAYPLAYADNTVDEIRASHVLEHFGHGLAPKVLADWVRVLKPGGRIRIAVPDFDKIADELKGDPLRFAYLMGGQTDENDYHKSVYTYDSLLGLMAQAGIEGIKPWTSANTDCASLPVSLNLEGFKAAGSPAKADAENTVKIYATMSVPRYGSMAARGDIERALAPFRLRLNTTQGVFWGQCMQREFERAVGLGVDWILTIDYDTMFTKEHLSELMDHFATNPHIDALAALQSRRTGTHPLMTVGKQTVAEIDGSPIKVTTAHFGLTLIRVDSLKKADKPWFKSEPDDDGGWGDHRLDDDIWFWHQWRLAGLNIHVDPRCRIGHLMECVARFDADMKPDLLTVPEWREEVGLQ